MFMFEILFFSLSLVVTGCRSDSFCSVGEICENRKCICKLIGYVPHIVHIYFFKCKLHCLFYSLKCILEYKWFFLLLLLLFLLSHIYIYFLVKIFYIYICHTNLHCLIVHYINFALIVLLYEWALRLWFVTA